MRTARTITLRLVMILLAVMASTIRPADAIPLISIQPLVSDQGVGAVFDINIDASSVTDLFAFQFDIGFDPAKLAAVGIAEGPLLAGGGSTFFIPGTIDNTAGTISFTADALIGAIAGVSGGGTLATISFSALSTGTSALGLSGVVLLDSAFSPIDSDIGDATVNITSVPEPSSLLLFGVGIVGMGALSPRRGRRHAIRRCRHCLHRHNHKAGTD